MATLCMWSLVCLKHESKKENTFADLVQSQVRLLMHIAVDRLLLMAK